MNKYLTLIGISCLAFSNGFSQGIDSILIQNNIKVFMFEDSEISYNPDSTICSYFSNDTVSIYINYAFNEIDTSYTIPNYSNLPSPTYQDTIFNNCSTISSFIYGLMGNRFVISFDTVLFNHIDSSIFNYFPNDSSLITAEQFGILDTVSSSTLSNYILNDTLGADTVIYLYQYIGLQGNFILTILGKATDTDNQILFNRMQALLTKFELEWNL